MALDELLSQHLRERPLALKMLKKKGLKVVAYNAGDFVPDELIYAAGATPVCQIHGGDPDSVEAAHSVVVRFLCPFARAQIGYRLLKEQAYYDLPDLLVIGTTCQHLRKIGDIWNYHTDVDVFRLGVPQQYQTERGLSYFVDSLRRMKEKLENVTGNKITDEKLKEAITVYNRLRELLKKISLVRKMSPSPLSTLDFIKLNHASYLADPNVMIEVLESVCEEVEQKRAGTSNGRPRLLLIAPNIALGDYKVLDLVEKAGGEIVAEEVCEGVRSYSENVEMNGGDPIEALAVKYLRKRNPCAFMRNSLKPRFDYSVRLAQDFDVKGVIWYQLTLCETYDIESTYFAKHLKEYSLPMLKLNSEYDVSDRGPIKTRIEAFLEGVIRR